MSELKQEVNSLPKLKKNKVKRIILVFSFLFLAIVFAVGILGYLNYTNGIQPVNDQGNSDAIVVTIPKGATTTSAAGLLKERELIHSPLIFKIYFRLHKLDGKLKPGEYSLSRNMSLPEIANKLVAGSIVYYSFTIPEGYNTKQIADVLEKKGFINRETFMQLVTNGEFDYDFLKDLPISEQRLEGYLFPDTYKIPKDITERAIIDMMLERFSQEVNNDYLKKAEALGLTLHQAVTLASIIEREAVKDEERGKVSAVFHNRINQEIKLESCATIQYALGEQKTRLLYEDLRIESPYNTYKYIGLPPGPIASPGKPSLQAAINPEKVDYLFFVVSENGEHTFSRTLAEHNRAKAKYVSRFKTP